MRLVRTIIATVAIVAALAVPASSGAQVADTYKGWGTVTPWSAATPAIYPAPAPPQWANAWVWYDGFGWWTSYRQRGERVYVWPFATGWSWAWSVDVGWTAMRTRDLSPATTTPPSTITTGVKGKVTYGPLCPVEPCTAQPHAVTLTFTPWVGPVGDPPKDVTTDAAGNYTVALKPGTYFATASVGINWMEMVTVPTTGYATYNFDIDTGIR